MSENDASTAGDKQEAVETVNEDEVAAEEDEPSNYNQNADAAANMFANMNLMDNATESNSDDENPMSSLPPNVLKRVEKLKELNSKRDELVQEYLADRAALEAKYNGLYEPLYKERAAIVKGSRDADIGKETTSSEKANDGETEGETGVKEKDDEEEEDPSKRSNVVGIPQFWVCAMSHMEPLAELITEEDVDCLEYCEDIVCIDNADGTGFTLQFHFRPNDYFTNTVLTKRYDVPNLLLDDEPVLSNVEGCKIDWKSNRSLTFREVTKKQRGTGKNAGMVRTVKKKEKQESFFHFFEPPKMPSMDEMDEERAEALEEAFEQDYDVAQAFRSHIIPKAVMWFSGQALEEEMDQMLGTGAAVDGSSNNPFPPSVPGERPPECDQQN